MGFNPIGDFQGKNLKFCTHKWKWRYILLKHSVVIFKQGHPTTWLFVFPRIISTLMTIPSLMYLGWMNSFELHFSKVFVKCYSLWESNSNFEIRNGNQSTTTNKLDASKSISKKSIQSGVAQLQVTYFFLPNSPYYQFCCLFYAVRLSCFAILVFK